VLVVPAIVLARIFSRLAGQQRQIDALDARVEALAGAPAERPRERPQPVLATETVRQVPSVEPEHVAEESLETRIGARWLLYVGVVAIVVGVAYFEKLAFENHWVSETARVIQGGFAGLALIYTGMRFGRAGYSTYGQMIAGCGAAILYVSIYAAFNFYHLIDQPVAFGLMVAVTAGTAVLADRERSQGLAVLAVGGGFATPFMLPGTTDAQLALFGYDTVLIAGTVALSTRRDWPLLDVISYVFTLLTVAAWGDRFYAPQKFLRTEIFLTIFCAMFLAIIYAHRRSSSPGVAFAKLVLWSAAPAYYLASLAVLGNHPTAMLVWLVALALTSAILTASAGALAGFGVWLAAALPLLLWCVTHLAVTWTTPGLIVVSTIYAIALAAQLYRVSEHAEVGPADVVWLHLNALLMFAGAYILIDAVRPSAIGAVAAAFAVWNGALAFGLVSRNRDRALHFAGVAFTLLTIAIGLQFDGAAVTIGWAAEGRSWVVGVSASAATGCMRRAACSRRDRQNGGSVRQPGAASQTPLLNARARAAFVIALCYALAWLHYC
jgi:uncharacterized membrane protein